LSAVIKNKCEVFLNYLRLEDPDAVAELEGSVPRNQWFSPGTDGFSDLLYTTYKDSNADSLLCWRLGHDPVDPDDLIGLPWDKQFISHEWLLNSFLTCSEQEIRHLIMIFGDEHVCRRSSKRGKAGEAATRELKTKSLERYGATLWNLYHEHQHAQKIARGQALDCTTSNHECLAKAMKHYAGLLVTKGNLRLNEGMKVDVTSHAVELLSDPQVAAIARYCFAQGTVFSYEKLTYFMLALSVHRRAGKEQHNIKKSAISVVMHLGVHEVLMVKMEFESKGQNFTNSCEYIRKADVMVVCPLTVMLVKWLLKLTAGHTSDDLWLKPLNRTLRVENLAEDAVVFSANPYASGTTQGWVKNLCALTQAYHATHEWPDLPFERTWPTGTDQDWVSGTGLRKRAETAMHIGQVPEKDALIHSGRAVGGSRDAYKKDGRRGNTPLTMQTEFKIGCIVMCPQVMRRFEDPPPVCSIPVDLLTNCDAGVLILTDTNWFQPLNTDKICRHPDNGTAVYYEKPQPLQDQPQQQPAQQNHQQPVQQQQQQSVQQKQQPVQQQQQPIQQHFQQPVVQQHQQSSSLQTTTLAIDTCHCLTCKSEWPISLGVHLCPNLPPHSILLGGLPSFNFDEAVEFGFGVAAENVSSNFSLSQIEPLPFRNPSDVHPESSVSGDSSSSCSSVSDLSDQASPNLHSFRTFGPCRDHVTCADTCPGRIVRDAAYWEEKCVEQQRETNARHANFERQMQRFERMQREMDIRAEEARRTKASFEEHQTMALRQQMQREEQFKRELLQQEALFKHEQRIFQENLMEKLSSSTERTARRSSSLKAAVSSPDSSNQQQQQLSTYYTPLVTPNRPVVTPEIKRQIDEKKKAALHKLEINKRAELQKREFQEKLKAQELVRLKNAAQKQHRARQLQQQVLYEQRCLEEQERKRIDEEKAILRREVSKIAAECYILFNPPLAAQMESGHNTATNKQINEWGAIVCGELWKMDSDDAYVPSGYQFYQFASKVEWMFTGETATRIYMRFKEDDKYSCRFPDYNLVVAMDGNLLFQKNQQP